MFILNSLEKQKTGKNPPVVQRNKFLEPNSPIMPHAFPQWIKAAESASAKFKLSEYPRTGVNRGYVLPEPAVFANHKNETSRQQYFLTYLKVREVFIAAISLLGPVVCQRSPKDWRRLVSLELHGLLNTETNEATAKLELCQEMNKVAARMGSSFVSIFSNVLKLVYSLYCSLSISLISLKILRAGRAIPTTTSPMMFKGRSFRRFLKFPSSRNFSCWIVSCTGWYLDMKIMGSTNMTRPPGRTGT